MREEVDVCGIVGVVGCEPVRNTLIEGLKKLEFRGYDSAGIAELDGDELILARAIGFGNIDKLRKLLGKRGGNSTLGVAHTRWATHGEVTPDNAHPHAGCTTANLRRSRVSSVDTADIVVVHNGTIENFAALRKVLNRRGHRFHSETDTEVLIHLVEDELRLRPTDLMGAVSATLQLVKGTYGIVVISAAHPNELIAAAHGSPIVIGPAPHRGAMYVASAINAFVAYTDRRVDLEDGHIARITASDFTVKTIDGRKVTPSVEKITETLEQVELGGFRHYMLKEIMEQPLRLRDTMVGRILPNGEVKLGGFRDREAQLLKAQNIRIIACGTSWHAGLIFGETLEGLGHVPTVVDYASQFAGRRDRNTPLPPETVAFAVSQSGETMDTIHAVKKAQQLGIPIFGICNAVGAKIPRLCGAGVYIHVGPEIGVASTKAFSGQVMAGALISLYLAWKRGTVSRKWARRFGLAIQNVPNLIERILRREKQTHQIKKLARKFYRRSNFLYLGRGINFPVALEGALKLKEISYIHAEGYPAGEMKHGPIALIDKKMPVVVIALKKHDEYGKVMSNIEEIKARKGVVIAIAEEGDREIHKKADYVIRVPRTSYWLSPLLTIIPLQLLAYEIARLRGCEIDKPRNLAKSVTVD